MADLDALRHLARICGIELSWHDIWGNRHEVAERSLRALLSAMHVPAASDDEVRQALDEQRARLWAERVPPVLVTRCSALPLTVTLRLPATLDAQSLRWCLEEEGGARHEGSCEPRALEQVERVDVGGVAHVARRLRLDLCPPPGYHRLTLSNGEQTLGETMLVLAPDACYLPAAVQGAGRVFGPAVQLYAVRSQRDWGMGDFTDLRLLLEQWSQRGAAIVGLNPLHALFAHDPARASPYSPSSRLFVNALYLDPEQIEEFHESADAQRLVASVEFRARIEALRAAELVDYAGVANAKMQVLELLYRCFRERRLSSGDERAREYRAFQAREGERLRRHALFEALQEQFHRADPNVWGWPVWPPDYRDPAADAVRRFAREQVACVEFYEWLQWQCDRQLQRAGRRSLELGLGVGLYGDLAVSVDRGGAEAWANQDLYAISAGVGAPPDHYSPAGQNWGLPPPVPERLRMARYAPFIATLRANMRHTGALRIDHVMGLMRLYWIPEGVPNSEGAYVHYPLHDLLGILALESQRNACMVIGEDLGTVPDEMRRAMHDYGVLSYRLLYFERREGGEFKAPSEYPAAALVAASTHDLPTLAGYWAGRDLQRRAELRLYSSEEAHRQHIQERAQDRARLLLALQREGLLPPGMTLDPAAAPEMTAELMRAIHVYLARAPSKVMMVQLEDVLGCLDQVNLPGTTVEHPNWRRKLPLELERWPGDERFPALCAALQAQRPRWEGPRPKAPA